ncbi:MAG: hypothetical protein ACP5G4_11070, partial [bacterium]
MSYGDLAFYTKPSSGGSYDGTIERMRITSDGDVGIGTSTPSSPLDVQSSGGIRVTNPASTANYMQMETPGTWHRIYTTNNLTIQSGGSITLTPASNLTFSGISGTGNHLNIDASGNITRTTISGGSSYWTDNSSYISANTITDGYAVNIYDDFDAVADGSRLYLTGYSYSGTRASLIRAIKTGNSATSTGHSAIYGSSDNYGASYWGHDYASCGVRGVAASYGQSYTAGVAGYRYDGAYGNSAGVFGAVSTAQTPTAWGALGFQDASLNEYGGYFNGNAMTTGSHYLTNTNTRILQGAGNSVRMQTNSGYIDVGPQNTTWAHIYTDRPSFYFNKELYVLGNRVWHDGYHPSSGVTGSGTSGRAARWTGTTSLGTSAIYDNGTRIGVGASPTTNNMIYAYHGSGSPAIYGYNSYGATTGMAGVAGACSNTGTGYLGYYDGTNRSAVYGISNGTSAGYY